MQYITHNPKNQKSKNKLLFLLLPLTILVICIMLIYFYGNQIKNTVALATKTPKEYYSYVEHKSLKEKLPTITNYLLNWNKKNKSTEHTSSLSQLTYDNTSLLSIYHNYEEENKGVYYQIPNLSSEWFSLTSPSSSDIVSQNIEKIEGVFNSNRLDEDLLKQLFTSYADFMIKEVNDVTMTRNINITINKKDISCTQLNYSYSINEFLTSIAALLQEASYDKDLEQLIVGTNLYDSSDYKSYLNLGAIGINMFSHYNQLDGTFDTTLWIDKKGTIIGRKLNFSNDSMKTTLQYQLYQKGHTIDYAVSLDYENSLDKQTLQWSLIGDGNLNGLSLTANGNTNISYNLNQKDGDHIDYIGSYEINGKYLLNKKQLTLNGILSLSSKDKSMPTYDLNADIEYTNNSDTKQITANGNIIENQIDTHTFDFITKDIQKGENDQLIEHFSSNSYISLIDYLSNLDIIPILTSIIQ